MRFEVAANVETWEICFNQRIDRTLGNIADTVKDRSKDAICNAIGRFNTTSIELASRSLISSSERGNASMTANPQQGERRDNNASFENVSELNNTFHEVNANEETWGNYKDELYELPV